MKRIFKILVAMLAIVGATTAEAQTKEFLEKFDMLKYQRTIPRSVYEGVDVAKYPAEMLRAMGINNILGNQSILNRLQVIYQIKIPMDKHNHGNNIYRGFTLLVSNTIKSKLYEQIMCNTDNGQEISIYKAIRKKNNQPSEFMVFIKNTEKAIICDVVGYITVQDVMKMLSPDLKNYVKEDTLNISNK